MGIVYLIGALIFAFIWGVATQSVIYNKGYSENWFIWGFLFGIIAFFVALTKPENRRYYASETESTIEYIKKAQGKDPLTKDSWRCPCGKVNPNYTGTCSCGKSKDSVKMKAKSTASATSWQCSCGKIYPDYIDKCGCGNLKNKQSQAGNSNMNVSKTIITCEICGCTDFFKQGNIFVCKGCKIEYSKDDLKSLAVAENNKEIILSKEESYWDTHKEERLKLEKERAELQEKLNGILPQADVMKQKVRDELDQIRKKRVKKNEAELEYENLLNDIEEIKQKIDKLGILKNKEKNALQDILLIKEQCVEEYKEKAIIKRKEQDLLCNTRIEKLKSFDSDLEKKIKKLQMRIKKIDDALKEDKDPSAVLNGEFGVGEPASEMSA